jgi:hypothetical protein
MNRIQTKPNRTVGVLFVIVIVLILISGLAPPAGAEENPADLVLKWESGVWENDMDASSTYAVDVDGNGLN